MNRREAEDLVAKLSDTQRFAAIDDALRARDEPALEKALALAEAALERSVPPAWWEGVAPQSRARRLVAKLVRDTAPARSSARLGVRLAAITARLGRIDDEALLLGRFARARLDAGVLPADDVALAQEAVRYLGETSFVPSAECAFEITGTLDDDACVREAQAQLDRGNPSFAALLAEMAFVRRFTSFRLGPPIGEIEGALQALGRELARTSSSRHDALAFVLARAYQKGGFVDARARDLVRAVLACREEALAPDEREPLVAYAFTDAFDESVEECYELAKTASSEEALREAIARRLAAGNLGVARRLCEMVLVRRFDKWYLGDPSSNVVRSLEKAAQRLDTLDDPGRLAARVLAVILALTQEPAREARLFAAAVFAREESSPEMLAVLALVGIDEAVLPGELHRVYRDAVDLEARVERFRKAAEAAGLSEYERAAYTEAQQFLESCEDSLIPPIAAVSRRISEIVEGVVPDSLLRSAAYAIESALRPLASGASKLLDRARILRAITARDADIATFEAAQTAELRTLDEVAWSITHENRVLAALEGFGAGLGGATLVLVDLPALMAVNLNAILAIATVYGFDATAKGELDRALALLAGGPRAALQDVEGGTVGRVAVKRTQESALAKQAALGLHTAARKIAARLAKQKLLQLVPVLGGTVGAGLNFHFTHTTTKGAQQVYRVRWLLRRARGASDSRG